MKQLWRSPKVLCCLILVASFVGVGCYNGWKRPESPEQGQGGGGGGPGKGGPSQKPYGFILFETFTPKLDGSNLSDCGMGDPIYREFRLNEWAERIAAAKAVAESLAEKVVYNEIILDDEACRTQMAPIYSRATTLSPVGSPLLPQDKSLTSKLVLHLQLAFWVGDRRDAYMYSEIYSPNWKDWAYLLKNGYYRAFTLRYFVLAQSAPGFFSSWRNFSPRRSVLSGKAIDKIDLTDADTAKRRQVIEQDTADFSTWLVNAGAQH